MALLQDRIKRLDEEKAIQQQTVNDTDEAQERVMIDSTQSHSDAIAKTEGSYRQRMQKQRERIQSLLADRKKQISQLEQNQELDAEPTFRKLQHSSLTKELRLLETLEALMKPPKPMRQEESCYSDQPQNEEADQAKEPQDDQEDQAMEQQKNNEEQTTETILEVTNLSTTLGNCEVQLGDTLETISQDALLSGTRKKSIKKKPTMGCTKISSSKKEHEDNNDEIVALVEAYIFGKPSQVLLDSGSMLTMASSTFIAQFDEAYMTGKTMSEEETAESLTGHKIELSKLALVNFQFGKSNDVHQHKVYVSDTIACDLVIGGDLLTKLEVILDYKKKEAIIGKETLPFLKYQDPTEVSTMAAVIESTTQKAAVAVPETQQEAGISSIPDVDVTPTPAELRWDHDGALRATKTIEVPARVQMFIRATMPDSVLELHQEGKVPVFEPLPLNSDLIFGRAVVPNTRCVKLRCVNYTEAPITLHKDTLLGTIHRGEFLRGTPSTTPTPPPKRRYYHVRFGLDATYDYHSKIFKISDFLDPRKQSNTLLRSTTGKSRSTGHEISPGTTRCGNLPIS